LEFTVPFQHKYGYIRDEKCSSTHKTWTAQTANISLKLHSVHITNECPKHVY